MKSGPISSIRQDPKNAYRYIIYVENEVAFDVHEDILVKYQLCKGKEIDKELVQEIIMADEENKAFLLALRYIGIRPRTSFQLTKYLVDKGYSEEVAKRVRDKCISKGYLDDAAFARAWVAERLRVKPRGTYVLRMELQQKGIAKEIIQETVKSIQRDDEEEAARKLAISRIRKKSLPLEPKEEQRLLTMLIRKGFSQSTVLQIRQELRNGKLLDYE